MSPESQQSARTRVAGYSGTALPRKLGIKEGHRLAILHAPSDFETALGELPPLAEIHRSLRGQLPFDVILLFVDRAADLERKFPSTAARLAENGGLWVAWPKKTSGVTTDVTEQSVRDTGLTGGLVDNKICAIDEIWSGLRFVYRLKDRR